MNNHPANGMLAAVPGEHIARGAQSLPDPATATAETMDVTLEADHAGRVKIAYQRWRYRNRKFTAWSWRAIRTDAAPLDATLPAPRPHASHAEEVDPLQRS